MGKSDILEWLERQRSMRIDSYFSQTDIRRGMMQEGLSLSKASVSRSFINILCNHQDDIDFEPVGSWYNKQYVIRSKHCLKDLSKVHSSQLHTKYNAIATKAEIVPRHPKERKA